ncbi:MAG: hypothetical protein SFU27_05310, partial [Thermonemataceae bacterium]|nr:hypothetical protein [Thermonemataceae bacterium]
IKKLCVGEIKNTEGSALCIDKVVHRCFLFKSTSQVKLLSFLTVVLMLSMSSVTLAPNVAGICEFTKNQSEAKDFFVIS